ncbi:MAG: PAS domain S-box protein [Caulobacteraceae bacterium]
MTRAYKKYQVLLVEDDKEQASMCINSFSKNSIKADLATSKKDATRLVSNNSYDAIIIDSAIKGTTGMEILTDIKKLNTDVPILMLAEHESPLATADVVKSILSGAFECIVKEPNYWDMLPKLIEVDINKYRISRINEQMQDEVRRFSYIVENIDDCVIMIDSRGRITYTNRSFNSRYGYEKDEIIGKDILAILSDTEVQNNGIQRLFLDRNQYSRSDEFSMIAKSGEQIQSLATVMTIRNSRNMIISSVILLKDITERKKAEEELTRSRDFYLTLLDTFPALIWKSNTNAEYNYFNSSWLIFTGSTMEKSVGYRWLLNVHPEDRQKRMDTYLEAFTERKPFEMEYRLRRHDGVYRWVVDMGRPYNDLNGNFAGYIGSCYDITNRKLTEKALKESEERFKHISFHDELTGIYNRSYFEQEMSRLDREFSKVKPLSIISIDIDGLKMINDTFGHKAGDKLLTDASKIISAPFKEEGTVFRIGGDEFCVILPGYDNAAIRAKKEEIRSWSMSSIKRSPGIP